MRLAQYLYEHSIKRSVFARRIGVSPQAVTGYCDGSFGPSRKTAQRIFDETEGVVSPNDFMQVAESAE